MVTSAMGEDLIYQYKKMMPRFLVGLVPVIILPIALLILFHDWVMPWFYAVMLLSYGTFSIFLFVEYFRSTKLVKGQVAGLKISDLTRAIYWSSVMNSEAARFSLGGYHYWTNVENVMKIIDGRLQEQWKAILYKYTLPTPRKMYGSAAVALLMMPIILAVIILEVPFYLTLLAMLGVLGVLFVSLSITGRQFETIRMMGLDDEVEKFTVQLQNELTAWIFTKSNRPIRLLVAGDVPSNASSVGSLFGHLIVEIRPSSIVSAQIQDGTPTQKIPEAPSYMKQITSTIPYLMLAALLGYLLVFPSLTRLIGKISPLSAILAVMSVGLLVFVELSVYWFAPFFRAMFRGEFSSSDFALVIKRLPGGILKNWTSYPGLQTQINFMLEIRQRSTIKVGELQDAIRLWIQEDGNRPPQSRYFIIEDDSLELTAKGKELADLVNRKLHSSRNTDSLSRFQVS